MGLFSIFSRALERDGVAHGRWFAAQEAGPSRAGRTRDQRLSAQRPRTRLGEEHARVISAIGTQIRHVSHQLIVQRSSSAGHFGGVCLWDFFFFLAREGGARFFFFWKPTTTTTFKWTPSKP